MTTNELPQMNMDLAETGCCPLFNPEGWDGEEIVFENKLFVKGTTVNFLYVPLNMGSMMKRIWKQIKDAQADEKNEYLLLSYDLSPWRSEHYHAVTKEVPGANMERLSGTFLTKVFEGPYKNAGIWKKEMEQYVLSRGQKTQKLYFFYTTCPKCAKHYGKNYTIAFAQVS